MTIASYSELVSEMGEWLNRADLASKIPTFIRLFEARMNRRLRTPDMEQTFTRTTIVGTDTYALNSRVRQLRQVYIDASPKIVLRAMSPSALKGAFPFSSEGNPSAYTIIGENLVLAPAPASEQTLAYSGYATLSGLSDSSTTNWLLDDHPDLYLFGSLARAEAYLKDDARVAVWKAAEDEALAEVAKEGNAKRYSGPLVSRPSRGDWGGAYGVGSGSLDDDPGDLTGYL